MLTRSHRLTKDKEYRDVYRRGRSVRGRHVTCVVAPVEHETRLGVVASRRVGGAVERNRAKRRLRHAAGCLWPDFPNTGWHIVLIATPATVTVDYGRLLAELRNLLADLEVISAKPPPPPVS